MQAVQRVTVHRSELDTLAEELTKQRQEVQVEREELVIAERVLNRVAEQDRAAAEAAVDDQAAARTLTEHEAIFTTLSTGDAAPWGTPPRCCTSATPSNGCATTWSPLAPNQCRVPRTAYAYRRGRR
ncbi:hypothetical protein [Streptomyces sp. NPDC101455]|uniref:hypothetical protein n=1 Tax=Streptomyces sp. NPDC101455 TaxID=3366142 RepID=UPI0037F3EF43